MSSFVGDSTLGDEVQVIFKLVCVTVDFIIVYECV
jgi:hypothetical protein